MNRFVSLGALALLAGCHSSPVQPARTPMPDAAASPGAASAGTASAGAASAGTAHPTTGPVPAAEPLAIPPRAAQQYAQALQLMKAGRNTDAELEFKQLVVAYPQFAGPQLNLGLLYLHDSRLPEAEAAFKAAL